MNPVMQKLVEKWSPLLKDLTTDEQVKSTATMLENQEIYLNRLFGVKAPSLLTEGDYSVSAPVNVGIGGNTAGDSEIGANTGTPAGLARYKKIAIPMVRRIFPELLANQLVGVQPMSGPVGIAYALRFRASNAFGQYAEGTELGYNTIDETYTSATTAGAGYELSEGEKLNQPAGALGSTGYDLSTGANSMREIGLTIEQKEVIARTRKLKARWSIEAEQDLSAMHNLDFEEEIMDAMAYEIAAEIDRELVGRIINAAKAGGTLTWNYGAVGTPSVTGADGRWEQEKFRTLYTVIINAAEEIARSTRMGSGNYVIVSPKVAVAMQALPDFSPAPVTADVSALKTGVSLIGTLGNGMKVFRDTFAYSSPANSGRGDFAVVGYKGGRESETGIVYCPYIPVMFSKAAGEESFSPRAGVMTRYGICDHLFGSQNFYRYIAIDLGDAVQTSAGASQVSEGLFYNSGDDTNFGPGNVQN